MSPASWTAIGWTMIHLAWVGLAIALPLAIARSFLKAATPETRYAVALAGLLALSLAPLVIFAWIYEPERFFAPTKINPTSAINPDSRASTPPIDRPSFPSKTRADPTTAGNPSETWLARLVPLLPWAWLVGSSGSMLALATGLVGVERLRRSCQLIPDGEVARAGQALASSLGLKGRVGVATCGRLGGPMLLGIIRPLILLPSLAFDAWTMEQVEMALLHELAHLKRWDNHVNLLQRLVEALLFFHPATWWLSAWVRLEREHCCDRMVVDRLGKPSAYAEMLANLAGARPGFVMGMADRHVTTRIRRILNLKDKERPMTLKLKLNLTLPEGFFGLIVAAIVGLGLTLASQAGPPESLENLIRAELRKAVADVMQVKMDVNKPRNGDGPQRDDQGSALTSLAEAQLQVGDRDGALATLSQVAPQADDLGQFPTLIEVAEMRREAGDLTGARESLERITRQVEAIKVAPTVQARPGVFVEQESRAMVQAELFSTIADQRIKLGDLEAARGLIRLALAAIRTQAGPTPLAMLGAISAELAQAGDRAGAIEALDQFITQARAMTEPGSREEALGALAGSLAQVGEVDRAIALVQSLKQPHARDEALSQIITGLTENDPEDHGTYLDPAGVKFLFGAIGVRPRDRDASRLAWPKIAEAVGQLDDKLGRARLLSTIAHLQALSGDLDGASKTAESIPDIKRADFPGPSDGFYDAIKPATLALVARYHGQAEGKRILDRASDLARAVATEDQAIYARITVSLELVRAKQRDLARDLLREAEAMALKQDEPRRSRCLALVVGGQIDVDDLARVTANVEAIRDYPGLEKLRAWTILADHHEKAGDAETARKILRQALANAGAEAEAKPPSNPRMGREAAPLAAISRKTFIDPDLELSPAWVELTKESERVALRIKLGDLDGALRLARAKPNATSRDSSLILVVNLLAAQGNIRAALDVAKTISTPEQRLSAIEITAYFIKNGAARE